MTDLRKAAELALEALEDVFDLEKKDVAAIQALRQALAQGETVTWSKIDDPNKWDVDAVNMSQERVDKTAKSEHEPWPSVQCVCGGTIYFKYTPPVSDYHEGWEEGFKAAKREWVGLTDEQIFEHEWWDEETAFAVNKELKEKNT